MSETTQNSAKPLRILLLEDNSDDAELIMRRLAKAGLASIGEVTSEAQQFKEQLTLGEYDLVLCDFSLQGWNGLDALRWARHSGFEMPFIYVSGTLGEDLAVQCIKEGATDYVLKNNLERLPHAVRRALEEEKLRQERKHIENELHESERQYQLLFDRNPQPMWVYDHYTLAFLAVNQAAIRHYGYSRDEFLDMTILDIRPSEDVDRLLRSTWKDRVNDFKEAGIWRHRLKDGRIIDVEVTRHEVGFRGRNAVLVLAVDVTERKRSEERLRQSEERFSKAFRSSPLPIAIASDQGLYLDINEAFLRMMGWKREEVVGRSLEDLNLWAIPEHGQELITQLNQFGRVLALETKFNTRSGESRTVEIAAEPIQLEEKRCILTIINDVTEARLLEQQLRQAQKMEAVGRLAGGIAHDFNNLIMVVESYAHLAKQRAHDPERVRRYAELMEEALERATTLTRQLLAFGRKHSQELHPCDLNGIVASFSAMLHHVMPEDLRVSLNMSSSGRVLADRGQIEQVLMNLALNARDAMPNGGTLKIETSDVQVSDPYGWTYGAAIPPGKYQMITVSDSGIGMDEATQARIFEPFFTTKPVGKGTGLGLATAYGIVKQHGGHIWVHSEPGRGTTMKLFFPDAAKVDEPVRSETFLPAIEEGSETLLLVEDQLRLREVIFEYLGAKGYNVLSAADGLEAMDICRSTRKRIDVLITDLIMPGARGSEVAQVARERFPGVKVIYMSGYNDRKLQDDARGDTVFLEKPFDLPTLTRAIRQMVSSRSAA
ncbi:MAG: PAS domain S-box protein [Acidobacteria bacterium]|nr:PAS domain S-box protein [Acidobacteriota bacterium]